MKKMTEQKKTQIRDAITVVIGVLITFTCLWFTLIAPTPFYTLIGTGMCILGVVGVALTFASMLKRPNTEDIRSTKVTKIKKETKVETKEEIV